MSEVLVAGGAGFIGTHVCAALINAGYDVVVADLATGQDLSHHLSLGRPDAVVNLAAIGGVSRAATSPLSVVHNNVMCAMHLASLRAKQLVHISSFSVYGSNGCAVRDDTSPCPSEMYGASKYMQELCFTGRDVSILRLSSVYGEGMPTSGRDMTILAKIASWIRNDERPVLFEDGEQTRDWVYVGDVCEAVVRLVGGVKAPRIVNVCSGTSWSLIDACTMVAAAMGKRCEPRITGEYRPGDMRDCRGNAGEFSMLLGRIPTQFPHGVKLAFGS